MKNIALLGWVFCAYPLLAIASAKPTQPYYNPHLAESSYSITHTAADFTPTAGPTAPSHRLTKDEVTWKKVGPVNSWAPMYSSPYPNGKRVIWVGGYDRVAKLDAYSLATLSTYSVDGTTQYNDTKISQHISTMDTLGDKAMSTYSVKLWQELFPHAVTFYRLLNKDNELFIPYIAPDRSIAIRVYGELDASDPSSAIELRREWRFPAELSNQAKTAGIIGISMTPDGWVIMVTTDGLIVALSQDFKQHKVLSLPRNNSEESSPDLFAAFVRNGVTADDQGGIYVVSRDYMHRVQWTGKQLSLKEADGAWSSRYPNNSGLGSGTTPGLMGWGDTEDHLVIIADGSRSNNTLAFWRDTIPADWQGIDGYDRRVAGIAPIHFSTPNTKNNAAPLKPTRVENAPVIYGYGVFFNNTFPEQRLPDQGGPGQQWLAESFYMHVPHHGAHGGAMIQWNANTRKLTPAWQTQTNLVSAICTVSGTNDVLYCWGARNREWTLEGLDWNTGNNLFHHTLGKSHRYNPLGGPILIAPNGDIDCGCAGGMGLVRVHPHAATNNKQGLNQ